MHHFKSLKIAYALWFFLGAIGAHRFYLGQFKTASMMVLLGVAVLISHFNIPLLMIYLAWWIFDALLIPGYVDAAADHSMIQVVTENNSEKVTHHAHPAKFVEIQEFHDLNTKYLATAARGDLEEAIKEATATLALCENQLGAEHGHAALIRYNLGEFYRRMGNNPQAISMYKGAIAIQEQQINQKDAPEQAQTNLYRSINGLAQVYASLGEVQDAKKLYRSIIDMLSASTSSNKALVVKKTGQYYENYANALNNLAMLFSDKGQAEQAQTFFTEATTLLDHLPAESSEIKVNILMNSASNESAMLNYERAEKLFQRALKTLENGELILSSESDQHYSGLLATSVDELSIDEPTDSHVNPQQTMINRAAALQRNQLQAASCHNGLGIIYANQNRLSDAEVELVAAGKIRKQIISSNDPEFLTGLSHLSLVYFKQNKFNKAEVISKLILEAKVEANGADDDDTKLAKRNLELIQTEIAKQATF